MVEQIKITCDVGDTIKYRGNKIGVIEERILKPFYDAQYDTHFTNPGYKVRVSNVKFFKRDEIFETEVIGKFELETRITRNKEIVVRRNLLTGYGVQCSKCHKDIWTFIVEGDPHSFYSCNKCGHITYGIDDAPISKHKYGKEISEKIRELHKSR